MLATTKVTGYKIQNIFFFRNPKSCFKVNVCKTFIETLIHKNVLVNLKTLRSLHLLATRTPKEAVIGFSEPNVKL